MVALLLSWVPARAAESIFLTWNDCPLGPSATSTLSSDCSSNARGQDLLCALSMPAPADSVLGVEIVVDLQHSAPALPDWWSFETDGCRQGLLRASGGFGGLTSCVDPWQGLAAGGVQTFTVGLPGGQLSQARVLIALAVLPQSALTFNDQDVYYAARILLPNDLTVGDGSCAGCQQPACLVLNSILVKRPPRAEGAPSTDILLQKTDGRNIARWQGLGANCQAVPVRRSTWGALKALYR